MTAAGRHVPQIASWPGRIAPGRTSGALVDLSDFLPTLLELAAARRPGPYFRVKEYEPPVIAWVGPLGGTFEPE
ncbi:MAG: hypothetical protein HY812_18015 [Planctomycetes bacterium]|nr:hypothetical protein [Planctomycetota bacterium]